MSRFKFIATEVLPNFSMDMMPVMVTVEVPCPATAKRFIVTSVPPFSVGSVFVKSLNTGDALSTVNVPDPVRTQLILTRVVTLVLLVAVGAVVPGEPTKVIVEAPVTEYAPDVFELVIVTMGFGY